MIYKYIVKSLIMLSILTGQDSYSLLDQNPSSSTYGMNVGPLFFDGKVVLHYFGAFTWGTCTTRFGELNEINESLKQEGYQVELIGVSKSSWIGGIDNWVNQGSAPICVDSSPYLIWNDWNASQRDLFITNSNGEIVFKENITSGIPNDINAIILNYLSTEKDVQPVTFKLSQNFPNPFNGQTQIPFTIFNPGNISVNIFDINGRIIKSLFVGYKNAGTTVLKWDGKNNYNEIVSSGIYFYKIKTSNISSTKKLIFAK